jgi:hypothetical protein
MGRTTLENTGGFGMLADVADGLLNFIRGSRNKQLHV